MVGGVVLLIFGVFVVGGVAAMVLGVLYLNKSREGASGGVWKTVADQLGGTYTPGGGFRGHRIDVQQPFTRLVLEVKLMSAVDVVSSPYHRGRPKGGTFTHAIGTYAVSPGHDYALSKGQAEQHAGFQGLPIAWLPRDAEIISTRSDVRIIMNGHVRNADTLSAAAHIVMELSRRQAGAAAHG